MKPISILLACLLLITTTARPAAAVPKEAQPTGRAGKVKAGVAQLGVGEAARVMVKLRDGSKLRGYVKEAGADSFVVVDLKTGAATSVPYVNVRQLGGHSLSTGQKIAIGFGIAAAVLLTLVLIGLHHSD